MPKAYHSKRQVDIYLGCLMTVIDKISQQHRLAMTYSIIANYNEFTSYDTGEHSMKNHKFWAWAMIVCLIMTVYTGYEHK